MSFFRFPNLLRRNFDFVKLKAELEQQLALAMAELKKSSDQLFTEKQLVRRFRDSVVQLEEEVTDFFSFFQGIIALIA